MENYVYLMEIDLVVVRRASVKIDSIECANEKNSRGTTIDTYLITGTVVVVPSAH